MKREKVVGEDISDGIRIVVEGYVEDGVLHIEGVTIEPAHDFKEVTIPIVYENSKFAGITGKGEA